MRTRKEAVQRAMRARTNKKGMCQQWTRELYDSPSVGDLDHDGGADAEDGWKSEPRKHRRTGRNVPAGLPVTYSGGSADSWHRAISIGNGKIRTTDGNGPTKVATRDLDWPEKEWGLKYEGYSLTIGGKLIPGDPLEQPQSESKTRGPRVDSALASLKKAKKGTGARATHIKRAIEALEKITPTKKK